MSKKLGTEFSFPKNAGDNSSNIETRESLQKANLQQDVPPPPETASQGSIYDLVRIAFVLLELIVAIVLFAFSLITLSPLHVISSFMAIVRTLRELLSLLKKKGKFKQS